MPEQVSGYSVSDSGQYEIPSAMDRAKAVRRIQEGLGFRSDREATIILRLQEAQRELELGKTLPKFLLVEDEALALATASHEVSLPTLFLRRYNTLISYLPAASTVPRFIPWRDYNNARAAYANSNPSGPATVSLRKGTLWFEPLSDRAYSLTWSYYQKGVPLETNTTNLWLQFAPEWLIGEAGLRIASDTRNASAITLFTNMRNAARAAWTAETVMEESEDSQPMCLGGNN